MAIEIKTAESRDELEAVYHFRYQIYVEEMHRQQRYADHARRRIVDPLDVDCHILAAWDNGQIVGTVRNNYLGDSLVGDYMQFYALDALPLAILENTSITTRLMVARHLRKTSLGVKISCALFSYALRRGIVTDFIDCNAHLVPLFTGLGYRLHRNDLVHPEYGAVTVMRLDMTDIDHFDAIRSPFRRIYRRFESECEAKALMPCAEGIA